VLLNVPVMTTLEYLVDARQALVMYASVISLALLASAALSMGVALVAFTWKGMSERRPADPWNYDYHDPATRAAEREGIDRLVGGHGRAVKEP
jgi:hypothetical protein